MWHCGIHLFRTPLSLVTYFSWESLPGHSNRTVGSRMLPPRSKKYRFNCPICIRTILSYSEIIYAGVHMKSCLYIYMFSIFCGICIMHTSTTYMESRLKTTHCLFKWCRWLKAVFIAVNWLRVLGNLEFDLYTENKNGYGEQFHWASLNKHYLLNNSLFVYFYCKYMWNIADYK